MSLFHPVFLRFKVNEYRATAIYYYNSTIRTYLYQFKGCFDYELYPIFISNYALFYHLKYKDYVVIPAPSFYEDDLKRGFNHVEMIFSVLKLKIIKVLIKTEHHKQADCSMHERGEISKYMKVKENIDLSNKKVLLVDDVYTSGETMKSMIRLVKNLNPKHIEILVLSKTIL